MSTHGPITKALICAPMSSELRPLVRLAKARPSVVEGLKIHRAKLPVVGTGDPIDLVISRIGVGPEAAKKATAEVLAKFPVDHVLVSGIAGGLDPRATIGTVVVPEEVWDLRDDRRYSSSPLADVERHGLITVNDKLVHDTALLDSYLAAGVIAMEMESSGVAAACEEAGVPWTTFRVISDRPDDGLTDDAILDLLRPDGTTDIKAALILMARKPSRIGGMMRLGRDAAMAAEKAARNALSSLGWAG